MHGWSSLHIAAQEGSVVDIQRILSASSVDSHALTPQGDSAISLAALGAFDDCLLLLLEATATLADRPNESGWSPLLLTVMSSAPACRRLSSLRLLLRHGADMERAASGGWCAILLAAKKADPEILALLLLHAEEQHREGLERMLQARTSQGDSALLLAAHAGSAACMRLLLAARARCDDRNTQGLGAVQLAVCAACSPAADMSDAETAKFETLLRLVGPFSDV